MAVSGHAICCNCRLRAILVLGAVLALMPGLFMAGSGAWLFKLGGSWYYVLAGIGFLTSGILLLRRKASGITGLSLTVMFTVPRPVQSTVFPTRLKLTIGTPNVGGPMVTNSGLTFIAAAQDNFLRAFETATGALLWEGRLPYSAQSGPMTYVHDGRQYVAVAAGGHARLETEVGDTVVVFALPE